MLQNSDVQIAVCEGRNSFQECLYNHKRDSGRDGRCADKPSARQIKNPESVAAQESWNTSQTIIDLQNEGMECNPLGQGYGSMGAPTTEFVKLVLTEVSAISMPIEGYIVVL